MSSAQYNCPNPRDHEEIDGLRQALVHELRDRSDKPDFSTFVELKHGPAGAVLWALQNGEISRGRAAECLAEIAHGATEVRLPEVPDAIPEDTTPLELYEVLTAVLYDFTIPNGHMCYKSKLLDRCPICAAVKLLGGDAV